MACLSGRESRRWSSPHSLRSYCCNLSEHQWLTFDERYRGDQGRVSPACDRGFSRSELWQSPSTTDLLASIGKSPIEKRARISPFLDFLGDGGSKQSISDEEIAALRNWVIQRLAKQMRSVKNPSITSRRDTALIAAICAAPAKGTPRKWPKNCLKITENEVLLWDASIEEPCFAISLRFWHAWRERLARPTNGVGPITPEKIRAAFLGEGPLFGGTR